MDSTEIESRVERSVRDHTGTPYRIRGDATWLVLWPDAVTMPAHGWKLHVSARPATFPDVVDRLVPVLLAEGCVFKLARSARVLGRLNNGLSSPASVGKAFTIYPEPGRVRDLGRALATLLRGETGPRVLSDRVVDPDAPVYYRYGPFTRSWDADTKGRLMTLIHGPDGEEFGALATMRYRQPAWAADPFTGAAGDDEPAGDEPVRLGHHYRVTAGIVESGRGNVFRAVDERDGSTVVVKQARAYVDEHDGAGDVRMRLRNERRVLQALAGAAGVPRFLDHFRHGPDEFLVTTDAGPRNLEEDVTQRGRYRPDAGDDPRAGSRDLGRLGGRLARIVLDLHARGVIVRDLTTRNIIVADDRVCLIDFGLADLDGLHVPGGTPGYAPAGQRRGGEPRDTDDLHALGMTLLFAAHGLHPVTLGEDLDLPRRRARQSLRARHGDHPTGVFGDIADLLSGDDERARAAARRLAATDDEAPGPHRGGATTSPRAADAGLPAVPTVTADLAATIADHLLADLLDQTSRVLSAPTSRSIAHDASVYSGSSGVGLELLWHLDRPGVADCLRDLVPFTVRAMADVDLPPGLLAGRTGADVFLELAVRQGFDPGPGYAGPHVPDGTWRPVSDDMIAGAAGVGLGHLLLHRATKDPDHLAVAHRCADVIRSHPPATTRQDSDPLPPPAAVEPSAGRAHGLAGGTELLLALADRTGDADLRAAGADRTRILVDRARSLADRTTTPLAASLAVSWCQGLAGITGTVRYAGAVLDDDGLTAHAHQLARVATNFLPRVSVPAQCCGAAGVGNLLLDLAQRDGGEWWDAAGRAGTQILLRGAGSTTRPVLVEGDPDDGSASWAFGVAGLLSFFRRLSRSGPGAAGPAGLALPDGGGPGA